MFVMQPYSYAILRPLQSAILARGDEVAWFLSGNDVNAASLTEQEHYLSTIEQVKAYKPDAVFVPGNVVPDFIPGAKVQVFHGLEYKKKGHFAIRGFFDLYCTHGPLTTEPFQKLAKKHETHHDYMNSIMEAEKNVKILEETKMHLVRITKMNSIHPRFS